MKRGREAYETRLDGKGRDRYLNALNWLVPPTSDDDVMRKCAKETKKTWDLFLASTPPHVFFFLSLVCAHLVASPALLTSAKIIIIIIEKWFFTSPGFSSPPLQLRSGRVSPQNHKSWCSLRRQQTKLFCIFLRR